MEPRLDRSQPPRSPPCPACPPPPPLPFCCCGEDYYKSIVNKKKKSVTDLLEFAEQEPWIVDEVFDGQPSTDRDNQAGNDSNYAFGKWIFGIWIFGI